MIKALKFQLYWWLQTIMMLALVIAVLMFFTVSPLLAPSANTEELSGRIIGMMTSVSVMLTFMTMMTTHSTYLQVSLGFGCTRKNHFMATQVIKVLNSCFVLLVLTLSLQFSTQFAPFPFHFTKPYVVLIFILLLAVSSIGETLGAMVSRYGKIAFIIAIAAMTISMAIMGGFIGFTFAADKPSLIFAGIESVFSRPLVLSVIGLAITLVLTLINWIMCSKSTYK